MQSRVLAILIAVVLALVATAALVVYVNGADRRAIANQEPVEILVARGTIKAGMSGEDAQNLKLIAAKAVPRESAVVGAFRSWSQLEGKFAAVGTLAVDFRHVEARRHGSPARRKQRGICASASLPKAAGTARGCPPRSRTARGTGRSTPTRSAASSS